jgi:ribosomal protein S27E
MKTKLVFLLAAVIAAASLSSCQSTAVGSAESAVMCDKCKTVWVKTPAYPNITGRTVTVFRDHQVMQCPDCEKAYVTFFKTGSLKHHCSRCGGTLSHCTAH